MLKAFWSAACDLIVLTHVSSLIFSKGASFLNIYQEEYLSGQAPENCSRFSVALCVQTSFSGAFVQVEFSSAPVEGKAGWWWSVAGWSPFNPSGCEKSDVDLGYSSELCELEGICLQCRLSE